MKDIWLTASELAGLPDMPETRTAVVKMAKRQKWNGFHDGAGRPLFRRRKGKGGGFEYHWMLLPAVTMAHLAKQHSPKIKPQKNVDWEWYNDQPDHMKNKAMKALSVLELVMDYQGTGLKQDYAVTWAASESDCTRRTIYNYLERVEGVARCDWLPALCPRYTRGEARLAEISDKAWEVFKADYLRLERPPLETAYYRTKDMADLHGWAWPSLPTIRRKIKRDIPEAVKRLMRYGRSSLKAMVPAQERDRTHLMPMEKLVTDGHLFDVWVIDDQARVFRPMLIAVQDLATNYIVGWRLDYSENTTVVRLAFKDVFETFGIPEHIYLDNGRAFASKMLSGGAKTRYRFKVKDSEPLGIFTALGIQLHWATPGHGQAKPIERSFGDLANYISKHPSCAGAYTGNKPEAKPEYFKNKAIPFDEFQELVAKQINRFNWREGRKSSVAKGRSFGAVFFEKYEQALPRRANIEQLRMCMLAAQSVKISRKDGTVRLLGNRYHSEVLHEHGGELVTLRFDPDNLHEAVAVYRQDGRFLCDAPCIAAVGFDDVDAAREQARKVRYYKKAKMALAELERGVDLEEWAKLEEAVHRKLNDETSSLPEPTVIRMVPQTRGNQAQATQEGAEIIDFDERLSERRKEIKRKYSDRI